MQESAPKRRRVSRDPDDAPPAPAPAPAPPSTVDEPPSLPSRSPSPARPGPSSFAPAPAPAPSLARSPVPHLLQRRRSPVPHPLQRRRSPSPPADTASTRPALGPVRSAQQLFGARAAPADDRETRDASPRPRDTSPPAGPGSGDSAASARSRLGSPPRRPPVKPSPRPLPPPAPEGDDELNAFLSSPAQSLSRNLGVRIPAPPEPELPPAVSDPVSSTPPRGIHSSPRWRGRYRQRKKKTTTKNAPMKSSPLKSRADSPSRTPRARGGPSPARQSPYARARPRPLRDLHLNPNTSAARQVPALGKDASRIRERDRLRGEVALLRRELDVAARENERIRAMHRSGRVVTPANEEDVLNLVQKTLVATGTPPSLGLAHQMARAALKPMGILPFGPPKLVDQQGRLGDDEAEIRSHHPVQMSAQDELPFLQLFSPFSATSLVSVLPAVPNQPIRQRRQITLRSRDMPGFFTARVDMVVNAMNLNILALGVPALEPSARPELGPFIDKICGGDCNRSMQHNIGIISWAMAEWYRLAVQRARFWCQLERSVAAKDDLVRSLVELRHQAPRDAPAAGPDEEALDPCHVADLLRFMGQRAYEMAVPAPDAHAAGSGGAAIRLEWTICIDWTGEAQSRMGLFLGVPGKWREADARGVFARVPKLFGDLLQEGVHPRRAVRTVVALLAGK